MKFKILINKKTIYTEIKIKAGIGRCTAAIQIASKAGNYKLFKHGAPERFLQLMWCIFLFEMINSL